MRELLERFRGEAPHAAMLVLGPQPVQSVSTYTGLAGCDRRAAPHHDEHGHRVLCAEAGAIFGVLPGTDPAPGESPDIAHPASTASGPRASERCWRPSPRQDGGLPGRARATAGDGGDASGRPPDRVWTGSRSSLVTSSTSISPRYRCWTAMAEEPLGRRGRHRPAASGLVDLRPHDQGRRTAGDRRPRARIRDSTAIRRCTGRHLRFYAGYPIESPDGYRVGALCVLDSDPRDPERHRHRRAPDLALLAQKELWASVDRTAHDAR